MNPSNPLVILYFAIGLLLGAVGALLSLLHDLPDMTLHAQHLHILLSLLPVLTISGVAIGGLTVLLARGIYLLYFCGRCKKGCSKRD